eukprot:gene23066-29888_t
MKKTRIDLRGNHLGPKYDEVIDFEKMDALSWKTFQKETAATVALEDVSVQELSVILENLSFASLVEPFKKYGVSGRYISRITSYKDVMLLAGYKINEVVAETFFEDFVLEWQSTGRISTDLLRPSGAPSSSLKGQSLTESLKSLKISERVTLIGAPKILEPPPAWVQTPLVFSRDGLFPEQASRKVYENQSSSRIEVWEAPASRRLVRLEYAEDKNLRTAMSANFIFISIEWDVSLDPLLERMNNDVEVVGGAEMWIERCPTSEGFCALHFSSKKIEFFDRVLDIAHKFGLKPFPNYFIVSPTSDTRTKRPGTQDLWNSFNDIGLPVDFINDNPPIKIGVIDQSFVYHENLPGSNHLRDQHLPDRPDPSHGTHVAGIIGATASVNRAVAMKGLCSPAVAELRLHVIFPSGGPPDPDIQYCFNDVRRVLDKCGEDGVSLVNLSMEWCSWFNSTQVKYVRNMMSFFSRIFNTWRYHVVISAGNNGRNLDSLQIGYHFYPMSVEIDVFSSLKQFSDRVTIIGASDMFGHLAGFSNYGNTISLMMAPGVQILSTSTSPDGDDVRDGTSQSAPFVTGAMALMKVRFSDLTYSQIVARLQNTVDIHFSLQGKCISGGRLNIGRALGLTRSLISEEERVSAYPLRDQAFVAHY